MSALHLVRSISRGGDAGGESLTLDVLQAAGIPNFVVELRESDDVFPCGLVESDQGEFGGRHCVSGSVMALTDIQLEVLNPAVQTPVL